MIVSSLDELIHWKTSLNVLVTPKKDIDRNPKVERLIRIIYRSRLGIVGIPKSLFFVLNDGFITFH